VERRKLEDVLNEDLRIILMQNAMQEASYSCQRSRSKVRGGTGEASVWPRVPAAVLFALRLVDVA